MPDPSEEVVVIVDRDNRVIGAAPRARMRAEGLAHRATYVLVFDGAGNLCVQKRTQTKDVYPGWWDPAAGGVVLAGESYEESARRELAEELGIEQTALETLFDFWFEEGSSKVWGRAFTCVWDGPLRLQPEEVESVERMAPREVLERAGGGELFTPDGLLVVERYLLERARQQP